jgi:hypothetical protein
MRGMSAGQLSRGGPAIGRWGPALLAVSIGVLAAIYGFGLGTHWRDVLAASPQDPGPASGLLVVAIIGGFSLVGGLVLMTSAQIRRLVGPSLFAFGVGLSCGLAIGLAA